MPELFMASSVQSHETENASISNREMGMDISDPHTYSNSTHISNF